MSKVTRWAKRVSHWSQETWGDLRSFTSGYRQFKRDGTTPPEAYTSMRRLYRKTNGRFNDAMGGLCRAIHRKQSADLTCSIFQDATPEELKLAANGLRRDGCYVFARKLPGELCDQLLNYSLTQPGTSVARASTDAANALPQPQLFDRSAPQSIRHQFAAAELFQDPAVQRLATDPYFFLIAQDYLGFNPVFDVLAMWWSAPTTDQQLQSRAAQQYHFDMDRLKFVKFFVYLTDVGPENGPHCYIRGSHKRKPAALLKDARLTDDEIRLHYDQSDCLELTGTTGTMLAVDTRGLHKGKPLTEGDRLIFQIQFADSLFGQNYPLIPVPSSIAQPLADRIASNRRCYANLKIQEIA